jgi:hypothetical protein
LDADLTATLTLSSGEHSLRAEPRQHLLVPRFKGASEACEAPASTACSGADDALGLLGLAEVGLVADGAPEVEIGQDGVGQIERAVGEDVDLAA